MARFQPAFNIWDIPESERSAIQPGQWVYAGDPSNLGRFYGHTGATTVVAWLGNAKSHKRAPKGVAGYFRTIRRYAQACKNSASRRQNL